MYVVFWFIVTWSLSKKFWCQSPAVIFLMQAVIFHFQLSSIISVQNIIKPLVKKNNMQLISLFCSPNYGNNEGSVEGVTRDGLFKGSKYFNSL